MKTHHIIIWNSILIFVILNSCVNQKKLTYLQFSAKLENSIIPIHANKITVTPPTYKLMSQDILYIRVITPDPKWSEIFNVAATGQSALTEESAALSGYVIDDNGCIELPFAGKLEVAGKTLSEVKVKLDSTFINYVNDASIMVRMVNNYVSIIGEVKMPGRYPMTKDRLNIFEALSMASDMSEYGKRQKVQLIRPTPYGPVVKEFTLSDRSILTSEYFYIMPNDIIYAQPLKAKSFQINSLTYSLILGSIATILSSVTTLFLLFGYNK
jgi:polysaccharide export outer membrane protein